MEFLLSVIELLFLSRTVEAVQGKMCQNSLPSGGGKSLGGKISGGRGRPWEIFFGFYKTRHILLSDSASCTVLRAIILTQYRRVTDRRTDGRNCRSWYTACNASIASRCKNYGFLCRSTRVGFCTLIYWTMTCVFKLIKICSAKFYIIQTMCCTTYVPPLCTISLGYSLRPRVHETVLPNCLMHLADCSFIIRMLFGLQCFDAVGWAAGRASDL